MTLTQFLVRSGRFVGHKLTAGMKAECMFTPEEEAEQDRIAMVHVQKYWVERYKDGLNEIQWQHALEGVPYCKLQKAKRLYKKTKMAIAGLKLARETKGDGGKKRGAGGAAGRKKKIKVIANNGIASGRVNLALRGKASKRSSDDKAAESKAA